MRETIQADPDALPIVRQCQLASVSRATYHPHRPQTTTQPAPTDEDLRQVLHRIALEPRVMATVV